jgi:LacI family transcriptional regulator
MCAYTPSAFVPHYVRIREELLGRIQTGELPPGARLPSLREICRDRGVSTITARRALLDLVNEGVVTRRGGLGMFVSGTRRRVRVLLAQIGFSEDGWRRNSGMFGQLVGGIAGAAWERDAVLSVIPINDAREAPEVITRLLHDQPQDGVLLRTAADVDAGLVDALDRRGVPFVCIKRQLPRRMDACVVSDDRGGALQATAHVLTLGHRRVALIVSTSYAAAADDIEAGFRQAHAQAVVPVDEALIRRCASALDTIGREQAEVLLEDTDRPTAIVTSSDLLALGVYEAARARGLRIPSDLAVVGFDDQEFASHLTPPLTTVRLSYYDLGHAAAGRLFDLLDGRTMSGPATLAVGLVPRASTTTVPALARARRSTATATAANKRITRGRGTKSYGVFD